MAPTRSSPSAAGVRAARAGRPLDLDRLARGVLSPHPRHRGQHAEQPVRPGVDPRRAGSDPRSLRAARLPAVTDEIYEHMVYQGTHVPLATLPGMARADGDDQRRVEDVRRHRLADRMGAGAGAPDRRHSQGARFPDRGRAGAATGGGRGRARSIGPAVLSRSHGSLSGPPRSVVGRAQRTPGSAVFRRKAPTTFLPTSPTSSDLPDTEFAVWLSREVGVTPVPGSSFFHDPASGRSSGAVRLLQNRRHPARGGQAVARPSPCRVAGRSVGGGPRRRQPEAGSSPDPGPCAGRAPTPL